MSETSHGVGLPGLLLVLFIGLKLGEVIDWPWVWVLSPLWIPIVVVIAILIIAAIVKGIGAASLNKRGW